MDNIDDLVTAIKKLGYIEEGAGYNSDEDADNGNHVWRSWRMPHSNCELKGTPFYYEGEKDFIHFTSLDNLYSILNDKHIRLYNLVNMDDKFELDYAKSELLFRGELNKAKEDLFCLSMCSSKDIFSTDIIANERREHLLWKLHGRNGYGVILRMSMEDNQQLWYDYYLTQMFYSTTIFDAIKKLNKKTDKEILHPTSGCFLKLPIYEFENEVRLVYNNYSPIEISNQGNVIYPLIYPDKLHKEDNIKYIRLPLLNFYPMADKIFQPYFSPIELYDHINELPKIKINEIILGYRYSEEDLKNLRNRIDLNQLGININLSSLKRFF